MRGRNKTPDSPTIHLRIDRLQTKARQKGWTTARGTAQGIGTSEANISRLLEENPTKRQLPGEAFIAAVLVAFPDHQFEDFFFVVPAAGALRKAS